MKAGSPVARYPIIYWGAEDAAGAFGSYQRGTTAWDLKILEALMRYSYIPWNQTGNCPMVYSTPSQVSMVGNSTSILANTFSFSLQDRNITSIIFETNQSVAVDYNITLSYRKTAIGDSAWGVKTSGGEVDWNTTIDLVYPSVTGAVSSP